MSESPAPPPPDRFLEIWPKCFLIFVGVIELIAVILLILTELGNVAANFWTVNVFAGGWCGVIMFIHAIFVFVSACRSPTRKSASRAVIVSLVGLVASAALISFDAAFLVRQDTCILTSSCSSNSVSTSIFSYGFQQSFFATFNGMSLFATYTASQAKFLFQSVQVGVGAVCFLICLIYIIVYFVHKKKAEEQVEPKLDAFELQDRSEAFQHPRGPIPYSPAPPPPPAIPQQAQYPPGPPQYPQYPPMPIQYPPRMPQGQYPPPPPPQYYPAAQPVWRLPPPPMIRVPQPPPGQIPWNGADRY